MSDKENSPKVDDPQDGFDLLEYPCTFRFKAMVRVADLDENQTASKAVTKIVGSVLPETKNLEASSNLSRTGKFESVTITTTLDSREELEAVYEALAEDSNVVMTL